MLENQKPLELCPGLKLARKAENLSSLLFDSPREWDESPMLRCRQPDGGWLTLNRLEVRARAGRVAVWLQQMGVQQRDHVGILGHNSIEWLLADFAILHLGAVSVPAYFTDSHEAVQYVFNNAECKLILVEPGEQAEKVKGMTTPVFPMRGEGKLNLAAASRNTDLDEKLNGAVVGRGDLAT
ncbi:MAG: AMP-binding protein, partial [Mariprofundaceae bacterium]